MDLMNFCHNKGNIYIYGAGTYGQRLHRILKKSNIEISGFLVSDEQEHSHELNKVPILTLSELNFQNENFGIIICVAAKNESDIRKNLEEKNINEYYVIRRDELQLLMRKSFPVEEYNFLEDTKPVSRVFGDDRGLPIDRYYINKFLSNKISYLNNTPQYVLEVGENLYSRRYFDSRAEIDVLDYSSGIDLTKPQTLPTNKYDLFICTQVFNFIFDLPAAFMGAFQVLKPGGRMLATVAGNISQVSHGDYVKWGDYWRFTDLSLERIAAEYFGIGNVSVQAYGNSAVATAFIQGLSVEDFKNMQILDIQDKEYAITISLEAIKK